MYTAMLLVMLATGPVTLKDIRGPYATESECKERVTAMRAKIMESVPGVRGTAGRCKRDEGDGVAI